MSSSKRASIWASPQGVSMQVALLDGTRHTIICTQTSTADSVRSAFFDALGNAHARTLDYFLPHVLFCDSEPVGEQWVFELAKSASRVFTLELPIIRVNGHVFREALRPDKGKRCKLCSKSFQGHHHVMRCSYSACKYVRVHRTCARLVAKHCVSSGEASSKLVTPVLGRATSQNMSAGSPPDSSSESDSNSLLGRERRMVTTVWTGKSKDAFKRRKKGHKRSRSATMQATDLGELDAFAPDEVGGDQVSETPRMRTERIAGQMASELDRGLGLHLGMRSLLHLSELRTMEADARLKKLTAERQRLLEERRELWERLKGVMEQHFQRIEMETFMDEATFSKPGELLAEIQENSDAAHRLVFPWLAKQHEHLTTLLKHRKNVNHTLLHAGIMRDQRMKEFEGMLSPDEHQPLEVDDDALHQVNGVLSFMECQHSALDLFHTVDDARALLYNKSMGNTEAANTALQGLIDSITQETTSMEVTEFRKLYEEGVESCMQLLRTTAEKLGDAVDNTHSNGLAPLAVQAAQSIEEVKQRLSPAKPGSEDAASNTIGDRVTMEGIVRDITSSGKHHRMVLLTYRYYTTSEKLFEKLVMQFCVAPCQVAHQIRTRVLSFITRWVEWHYELDWKRNHELRDQLKSFLVGTARVLADSGPVDKLYESLRSREDLIANELLAQRARLCELVPTFRRAVDEQFPGWTIPEPKKVDMKIVRTRSKELGTISKRTRSDEPWIFEIYTPREFAEQLTLMEHELFGFVRSDHLISQRWSGKDRLSAAPPLVALPWHFNEVSDLVLQTVLSNGAVQVRAQAIRWFIMAALHLHKLHNYTGVMELVAGLESTEVSRLKKSWIEAGEEYYKIQQQLRQLLRSNYKYYRKDLARSARPVLPFIGTSLTDLTFTEDGNDTIVDGAINAFKMNKISNIIHSLMSFQDDGYLRLITAPRDEDFVQLIAPRKTYTTDHYERSLILETRTDLRDVSLPRFNLYDVPDDEVLAMLSALRTHPYLLRQTGKSFEKMDARVSPMSEEMSTRTEDSISSSLQNEDTETSTTIDGDSGVPDPFNEEDSDAETMRFLSEVAACLQNPVSGIKIKDRRWMLKTFPKCFVGNEAVTWIHENLCLTSRPDAVAVGEQLLKKGFIEHCCREHDFKDKYLFYHFTGAGVRAKKTATGWLRNHAKRKAALKKIVVANNRDHDKERAEGEEGERMEKEKEKEKGKEKEKEKGKEKKEKEKEKEKKQDK